MQEFSIVIPVFNQLHFTRQCLESLERAGVPNREIVVIDNGSTDGTDEFLRSRQGLQIVSNDTNKGCSFAWNQGVEALPARKTVVLNNDVIIPEGWKEGLLSFAHETGCEIVGAGQCDGDLSYDFEKFSAYFMQKMHNAARWGPASGVCFMVDRKVFEAIGLFDTQLGQAGYEDEDLFRRARAAGFRIAMTGRAFLHHFGSRTQNSVKASRGLEASGRLGNRDYFRKKHGLNWFRRRWDKLIWKIRVKHWRDEERRRFGFTLDPRPGEIAAGNWQS